jgi:hypothetical protein
MRTRRREKTQENCEKGNSLFFDCSLKWHKTSFKSYLSDKRNISAIDTSFIKLFEKFVTPFWSCFKEGVWSTTV